MPTFSDIHNSIETADEHTKLHIKENNILIKFDIKINTIIYTKNE